MLSCSLAQLHTVHMSVLEPRHSAYIDAHLEGIHRTGRRSRVLEVGAVSFGDTRIIGVLSRYPAVRADDSRALVGLF